MASADLQAELTCPICTGIYTDPVTLTCGHNYCQKCITRTWDHQDESEYSCPECRRRFRVRPELKRNLRLRNIAEVFQIICKHQEEGGISCTYCNICPGPAVKTCLMCEASLCENHLKLHSKSEEHILTEPTTSLGNRQCSIHKKVLGYYCCEHAASICVSCILFGDHRGHPVETLDEVSKKKKEELRNNLEALTSERKETEKKIQRLQELKGQVQREASGVAVGVTTWITNKRKELKDLKKRVLSQTSRQEEQVLLQISDLIQQLEKKKEDLSRKMGRIEELCNMKDPLTVLQGLESDGAEDCDTINKHEEDNNTVHSVRDLDMGLIAVTLCAGLTEMAMTTKRPSNIAQMSDLLLDEDTANNYLTLSSDLKYICFSKENKGRPNRKGRFSHKFPCVLSTRSFSSGRYYWEVEVSKSGEWGVSMAYPSIDRRGVGDKIKCWGVVKFKSVRVTADSDAFYLPGNVSCQRLGIYLDYKAGRLSFYNLRDLISHLHTFTVTFTEPLLFLFTICGRGWVRLGSSDY